MKKKLTKLKSYSSENSFQLTRFISGSLAFTLAEVLIVLGIIGIVAELTIPDLVNSYQEKIYLTQFKKVYSTLQQAYLQAANENSSTADTWTAADALTYIKPYLNVTTYCPGRCYDHPIKTLDGNANQGNMSYHFILADGTMVSLTDEAGVEAWVDTNGAKPPNQWGYDVFALDMTAKNNAPVIGWPFYLYTTWPNDQSSYCNKGYAGVEWVRGIMCSYWVIRHGNMDYLHRNIPNAEWVQ